MYYVALVIVGLLIGFVGGYAGIGGAPFIILMLTALFGVDQHTAQGTVLAVMLCPMTLMGILASKEYIKENVKYALIGCVTYAIFSYIGAYFAFLLNGETLKVLFSVLLIFVGINEAFQLSSKINPNMITIKLNSINVAIVGILVGIIGGLFGIGAGILMTPIFLNGFDLPKDRARLLSLLILLPPVSMGAVIKYNAENAVLIMEAIIIFVAYFVTNYFGAKLAIGHSEKAFKKIYGYILAIVGVINMLVFFIK